MATFSPPASRNAPCPCGSGRRYKDCHGRVGATADAPSLIDAARAAQSKGRFAEAITLCDRAIAASPGRVDAWHLRGALRLQIHDFGAAARDLARALESTPGDLAIENALAHANRAYDLAGQEDALCRELLPRYARYVVDPPVGPLEGVGHGTRVLLLDACVTGPAIADALAGEAKERGGAVERIDVDPLSELGGAAAARVGAAGPGEAVVCVGCLRPLGDAALAMRPDSVALVVDRVMLMQALDRLRELAGFGRRRVRLARSRAAPMFPRALPHVDGAAW